MEVMQVGAPPVSSAPLAPHAPTYVSEGAQVLRSKIRKSRSVSVRFEVFDLGSRRRFMGAPMSARSVFAGCSFNGFG